MIPMTIEIHGLRLGRGGNDRGGWRARFFGSRKTRLTGSKRQREAVATAFACSMASREIVRCARVRARGEAFREALGAGPWIVTVTRIAPGRGLDGHDNLATACKHVIDEVASWMGVDDRDERVEWRTEQARGPWGVRVRIEDRS